VTVTARTQSSTELRAPVFDIQRFSIHDGPGIRTLVFLKGCPLRCVWCCNPEGQATKPELLYSRRRCILCGSCVEACPAGAISLKNGAVETDRHLCTCCGDCVDRCYAGARRIAGLDMTVEEVYREVEKDRVFYHTSGGGVTVSGGEPTLWPDFVRALLHRVRSRLGVSTAVETCGCAPWSHFEKIIPSVEKFFFDVKHMDTEVHRAITGAGNERILDNLVRLDALKTTSIVVRIPYIPGLNDQAENMVKTGAFVARLENVEYVELLPFHRLGIAKYEGLGQNWELGQLTPPSREALEEAAERIRAQGPPVVIGG